MGFDTFWLMFLVAVVGVLIGASMPIRTAVKANQPFPKLNELIPDMFLCSILGVVGSNFSIYLLDTADQFMIFACGVFVSFLFGLFSNQEIKAFFSHIAILIIKMRFKK